MEKVEIINKQAIFKNMADNLSVIALKLDQMAERQENTDKKVSMLTERVLNPESGVFAKIQANNMSSARNRDDIDELHESVEKLLSVCESHERNISIIENWMKNHEERDNELRENVQKFTDAIAKKFENQDQQLKPLKEDFIVRTSNKTWKEWIIRILIGGLITALVLPPVVKLFKNEYQEKTETKIETKVK